METDIQYIQGQVQVQVERKMINICPKFPKGTKLISGNNWLTLTGAPSAPLYPGTPGTPRSPLLPCVGEKVCMKANRNYVKYPVIILTAIIYGMTCSKHTKSVLASM